MFLLTKKNTGAFLCAFVFLACLCQVAPPAKAGPADDTGSAVVFAYQRVGEDSLPQSSISLEQFKTHLKELKEGGYTILPLGDILDTLKSQGKSLPPRTVALTFDGASTATISNITPLLKEEGIPFTLFFASDTADGNGAAYLTWDQLKKLKKTLNVTFGILPAAYAHMTDNTEAVNTTQINKAIGLYRDHFGEDPSFFAYPYGEYSKKLKESLKKYEFKGVFGQHSGVIDQGSDTMALPRFTMTDDFGDLDRFRLTARAKPLHVSDITPDDMLVMQNPPVIGFTVDPSAGSLSRLSCFASGIGKVPLTRLADNRIEIRLIQPLTDRRTRINCTLPESGTETGVTTSDLQIWRWFGMILITPGAEDDDISQPAPSDTTTGTQE